MSQLKEVFKSWRFWSVFLIALGTAIQGLTEGKEFIEVLIQFITWIASGAAGIRTLDRAFEQFSKVDKNNH